MPATSTILKNYARGGGSFHTHRLQIIRAILDGDGQLESLSTFLRDTLFKLRPGAWSVFKFNLKDWELCDRIIAARSSEFDAALLALLGEYVISNLDAVRRLHDLSVRMSAWVLRSRSVGGEEEERMDAMDAMDAQSLFGLRVQCAVNQRSIEAMGTQLRAILGPGWARSRLSYPMMYHFVAHPPAGQLDSFLSYVLTGEEQLSERFALKLMLSNDAGADLPLAFKLYIGLMGHPYDALEFVFDHVEQQVARDGSVDADLLRFVDEMAALLPDTRASRLSNLAASRIPMRDEVDPGMLTSRLGLEPGEATRYAALVSTKAVEPGVPGSIQSIDVLSNMRAAPYPSSLEFQYVTADAAIWSFIEAGRLITSLLRSMYMIDRVDRNIEARDVVRLLLAFGTVTPVIASAPSAMLLLRRLAAKGEFFELPPQEIERFADTAVRPVVPHTDRLWINLLQWDLRRLEEAGRTEQWLRHVRAETKLRPSYLTGINWHWVEEVIRLHRLRPFRSFDGAFLFIHMELERQVDPLRLRLVLDPLLRGLDFDDAVERIVMEFGTASPAIVRRYLTTQNMLASGQASNYVAALDQRVRALEACIRAHNFGPLLTEEMYESEVRTLTAELLLSDVNAGKFEVPWATFRKDANASHEDLLLAVDSLRTRPEDESILTELTETPISYLNGASERYRVRQGDRAMFSLIIELIKSYMQHPAFGLEVILSGRFRHNNLVQELWAVMASTNAATIPGVSGFAQTELIEGYRDAAETFVDAWCSTNMQTKRPDRQQGLFNLVPTQKDVDTLIAAAGGQSHTSSVVDIVTVWIKDRLRKQVSDARAVFCKTFGTGLQAAFENKRDEQSAALTANKFTENNYRQSDIQKVYAAVNSAVMRKVDTLADWFDGIDAQPTDTISLADLCLAVEALFENMIDGRTLRAEVDSRAADVLFGPDEVKIAFDLLREVYFNALRHGPPEGVRLSVQPKEAPSQEEAMVYIFTNDAEPGLANGTERFEGSRYSAATDAVLREGNSGRAKIAASAATLIGRDTTVHCITTPNTYALEIPLRPGKQERGA